MADSIPHHMASDAGPGRWGKLLLAALVLAAWALSAPASGMELPRRASHGAVLAVAPPGQSGVLVTQVSPDQSAAAIGVRAGDLIVAAGGVPVTTPTDVANHINSVLAGRQIELTVLRQGRELLLRGTAMARPFETYRGARAQYGSLPFGGGRLRDILVMPDDAVDPPVLFIIQGFTCGTMESADPNSPYRRIAQTLADEGIATYRVEKPGVGDSVAGRQHCLDMNFSSELDAFRAAYTHLVEILGFDQDRVFMLGHSLGGMQAPLLAAERAPRGVAIFGSGLRNWGDYHQSLNSFQAFMMYGRDPANQLQVAERNREIFHRFYFQRHSPARIAEELPHLAGALRSAIGWDGGERAMGRHYSFVQEVAQQRLGDAWRDTRSKVLTMFGESDVAAMFNSDHWLVAEIANHYRPGTGQFVQFPRTDHGMALTGDLAEFRRRAIEADAHPRGPFNLEIAATLTGWILDSMKEPPVRTAHPDR